MTTKIENLVPLLADTFRALGKHLNHDQISPLLHQAALDLETAAGITRDAADLV